MFTTFKQGSVMHTNQLVWAVHTPASVKGEESSVTGMDEVYLPGDMNVREVSKNGRDFSKCGCADVDVKEHSRCRKRSKSKRK